jgi:hypothetical protein
MCKATEQLSNINTHTHKIVKEGVNKRNIQYSSLLLLR